MNRWIVITTINAPTTAVARVSRLCTTEGWRAVVIGDTRTPEDWSAEGIDFLGVLEQERRFGALADAIPYRHYSRKNLGYLYAIEKGADLILDMDDDNIPYEHFGRGIEPDVRVGRTLSGADWVNVYPHFLQDSRQLIWPRGLPLDSIHEHGVLKELQEPRRCPVQQYLADSDPDVDAIYRLLHPAPTLFNRDATPVVLTDGAWVPFNAQNTVFFKEAFPLTYLPAFVSFRMTDIWRSFVALAAMGRRGLSLSFHASTVDQQRNVHDLMRDFADEVPGYLHNRRIGATLRRTASMLPGESLPSDALLLWKALVDEGLVPPQELGVLEMWMAALRTGLRAEG